MFHNILKKEISDVDPVGGRGFKLCRFHLFVKIGSQIKSDFTNAVLFIHFSDFFSDICFRIVCYFEKDTRRVTYDCFTISRFLTYARILDPSSKLATWNRRDSYYEQPDFDYQHILRFMDLLENNYDDYLMWLFKYSNSIVKRDTSVLYYDCTNFYFECEQPDEDIVDEVTGEVIHFKDFFF